MQDYVIKKKEKKDLRQMVLLREEWEKVQKIFFSIKARGRARK